LIALTECASFHRVLHLLHELEIQWDARRLVKTEDQIQSVYSSDTLDTSRLGGQANSLFRKLAS
jgi:hypothetical protein